MGGQTRGECEKEFPVFHLDNFHLDKFENVHDSPTTDTHHKLCMTLHHVVDYFSQSIPGDGINCIHDCFTKRSVIIFLK